MTEHDCECGLTQFFSRLEKNLESKLREQNLSLDCVLLSCEEWIVFFCFSMEPLFINLGILGNEGNESK
jgi:hypothetical protein